MVLQHLQPNLPLNEGSDVSSERTLPQHDLINFMVEQCTFGLNALKSGEFLKYSEVQLVIESVAQSLLLCLCVFGCRTALVLMRSQGVFFIALCEMKLIIKTSGSLKNCPLFCPWARKNVSLFHMQAIKRLKGLYEAGYKIIESDGWSNCYGAWCFLLLRHT